MVARQHPVQPNPIQEGSQGRRAYLVDILALPDELLALPPGEHAKLGADETDLARATPRDGRRARERDELVKLDERALEALLHEHVVLLRHRHLQRDQRRPEDRQRPHDPQDVVLLEPTVNFFMISL